MLNINLNFKQKSTKEKYNPIIEKDSIFKPIKGFENMYEISNYGIIKSVDRNIICKDGQIKPIKSRYIRPADNGSGYKFVYLWKDNKQHRYYIHRLVAETFLSNPDNLSEVNHIDNNKANNNVNNLEWCDKTYNNNYGTRNTRISNANKDRCITPVICLTTNEIFKSVKEASNKYNIHQSHICHCCKNQRKSAGKHPLTGAKLKWAYHMPKE